MFVILKLIWLYCTVFKIMCHAIHLYFYSLSCLEAFYCIATAYGELEVFSVNSLYQRVCSSFHLGIRAFKRHSMEWWEEGKVETRKSLKLMTHYCVDNTQVLSSDEITSLYGYSSVSETWKLCVYVNSGASSIGDNMKV